MYGWIHGAVSVLCAAALAFWGFKRHEKTAWPVGVLAFCLLVISDAVGAFDQQDLNVLESAVWVALVLVLTPVHFLLLWLVWRWAGKDEKRVVDKLGDDWREAVRAARWAAPALSLVAWLIGSAPMLSIVLCVWCYKLPSTVMLWARRVRPVRAD